MEMNDPLRKVLAKKGGQVVSVVPNDTVYFALEQLARHNIGALLVMDGGKAVGILSERDYARKLVLVGRASKDTAVKDVMNSPVTSISPDQTVDVALALMSQKHIRHLPVLEGGRIVGMVSIGDLVNWVISAQAETIEHLHEYISGNYPG